jgi:hypothetical protein
MLPHTLYVITDTRTGNPAVALTISAIIITTHFYIVYYYHTHVIRIYPQDQRLKERKNREQGRDKKWRRPRGLANKTKVGRCLRV